MIFSNTLLHWCIQGMTDRKILSFSKRAITTCAPEHFCTLRIGAAPALGRSKMLRGEKGRRGEPGWSPHALGLLLHCPRAAQAAAVAILGTPFCPCSAHSFTEPDLTPAPASSASPATGKTGRWDYWGSLAPSSLTPFLCLLWEYCPQAGRSHNQAMSRCTMVSIRFSRTNLNRRV